MKELIKLLKKYRLSFIIALIVVVLSIILFSIFFKNSEKVVKFENENLSFNYDKSWNISNKTNSVVNLKNGKKASLKIQVINIKDQFKYSAIFSIIDDLLYSINSQNKKYNLLYKKDIKVTKQLLNGYKLLYENNDSQVMVVVMKKEDKLVLFIYEANNKYFDILLDSVENIIYNFKLKSEQYNLSYKLSVDTNEIVYSDNENLVKKIKKNKKYEIASNNYSVNYSLPNIFRLNGFDSTIGLFDYIQDDNSKINVQTNIYNFNMYDYLDSTKVFGTIYSDYLNIKNDKKNNKNISEAIDKIKIGKYRGYIYKLSYINNEFEKNSIEIYKIAIELNKNHIFVIEIKGNNIKIPKEIINNIKINKVTNYSSYVKRKIKDGNVIVEMKRFNSLNYDNYDIVKLKLPEKYLELDQEKNIYSDRIFALNYDIINNVYQYNINYKLSTIYSSEESEVELVNSMMSTYKEYGDISNMIFIDNVSINGINYLLYKGSYYKKDKLYNSTEESTIFKVNNSLLLRKLDTGGYLVIVIEGNNVEIDNAMFNEILNMEIETNKNV